MGKNPNRITPGGIQRTTEAELVARAQSGDFKAFTRLIRKYQPKIFGLAMKLTKNRQDAEDILQETLLKAVDRIDRFRGESSFGTWLYIIAVNLVRARYRRSKEPDLLPLHDYLPAGSEHGQITANLTDWKDPLSELTSAEVGRRLDEALNRLPLKYRMPFFLRYTQDLEVSEVAKVLSLSVAATKSRILRARLALQKYLGDYLTGDEDYGRLS